MTLRALVVDDEPLAIERMQSLLARIPTVAVAATAETGDEALAAVAAGGIDLLFLDVEMPQLDGFDLIEQLMRRGGIMPHVVLVTAHEAHAPMAFDCGVLDFLTKPVRLGRLETAVARAAHAMHQSDAAGRLSQVSEQLDTLRRTFDRRTSDYLWVQRRGESIRIDLSQIVRVQAEGEYVRLFVDGADYLHRESLTAMLARLDEDRIVRIHRSSAIDRDAIASVRRRTTGNYQVTLRDGSVLPVGRTYRQAVRGLMAAREE